MENISSELNRLLIEQREHQYYHAPIDNEYIFYTAVQAGDVRHVRLFLEADLNGEQGLLSKNPIRNEQYHFVICIGLVTRFCIEGGMNSEEAYTLSDIYIQRADKLNDVGAIVELRKTAVIDFTKRMKLLKRDSIYSKHVIKATEYIENHLTDSINVKNVASALSLHPDYLSRLFKENTGISMTSFIQKRRVEISKHLLLESNETCTDISSFMGFSSCSHYITTFKKHTGLTPEEFRMFQRFSPVPVTDKKEIL